MKFIECTNMYDDSVVSINLAHISDITPNWSSGGTAIFHYLDKDFREVKDLYSVVMAKIRESGIEVIS